MAEYRLPGEPLPDHDPILPPNPNVIRIVIIPHILLYMPNDWYIYEYEDFNQAPVQVGERDYCNGRLQISALNELEGVELPAQEGNNT